MGRHVARMVEVRNIYKFLVGKLKVIHQSEELSVDGRNILEWILRK